MDAEENRKYQTIITEQMLKRSILFSNRFYATLGIDKDFYQIFEKSLTKAFNKVSNILENDEDPNQHIEFEINRLGIYS